jgi:hypothetical protein
MVRLYLAELVVEVPLNLLAAQALMHQFHHPLD